MFGHVFLATLKIIVLGFLKMFTVCAAVDLFEFIAEFVECTI